MLLANRLIRRHASSIRSVDETRRAVANCFQSARRLHVPSSTLVLPQTKIQRYTIAGEKMGRCNFGHKADCGETEGVMSRPDEEVETALDKSENKGGQMLLANRSADENRREFVNFFVEKGHVPAPAGKAVERYEILGIKKYNRSIWYFAAEDGAHKLLKYDPEIPASLVRLQRCIISSDPFSHLCDIDKDLCNPTFFEMLGSHSLKNAYGKETACKLVLTYLTERMNIPKDGRPEDIETRDIWLKLGLDASRIIPCKDENFWINVREYYDYSGPSTEIHYDTIEGRSDVAHLVNRDDSIAKLSHIIFGKKWKPWSKTLSDTQREAESLRHSHIHTGVILERLTAIKQGVDSVFKTDLFRHIYAAIEEISTTRVRYLADPALDVHFHRVADSMRAVSVALADGMKIPGEPRVGDAAFVRSLIWHAAGRAHHHLGIPRGELCKLVPVVLNNLSPVYPELVTNPWRRMEDIESRIMCEEEKYWTMAARGDKCLAKILNTVPEENRARFLEVHRMAPYLMKECLQESGLQLDLDKYYWHMRGVVRRMRMNMPENDSNKDE